VRGRAHVFVGDKRAGKSTTAATFIAAGHHLLTDDVVAISFDNEAGPAVLPAFPQVKLSREASESVLIRNAQQLPLVRPDFEKHQHRLQGEFLHCPVPLHSIHVLERGERVSREGMPAIDAVRALVRFSHLTRHGDKLFTPAMKARHMSQCALLAKAAPVDHLVVPTGLQALREVVPFLEDATSVSEER
jgi:hypothetical protein